MVLGRLPEEWNRANITFLELFPIVIAFELWGHLWKKHSIVFIQIMRLLHLSLTNSLQE